MVSKSLRMNASASPEVPATPREFKRRVKSLTSLDDPKPEKYIHVHHFKNTQLFGAWFNDPTKPGKKLRLFFGSHLTAYLAARAQDRAALKYKPHALDPRSIELNFKEEDYVADQKLRELLTCEEFGELLRKESRPKYTKMEPTPCLRKFLAHERAQGNIPSAVPPKEEGIISLRKYLKGVIRKRKHPDEDMEDPVPTPEQKKHASEVERKKRSEGKRIVVKFEPRTPRSPVAGPSERKPLVSAPAPLISKVERKKRSEGKRIVVKFEPRTPRSPEAGPSERKPLVSAPAPLISTVERKKRSEGKRIVVKTEPRTPRSPGAGPSERKPLVSPPAPLIWGQTRQRTERPEDGCSSVEEEDYPLSPRVVPEFKLAVPARNKVLHKLQYKLHKIDSNKKSREPAPPIKPEGHKIDSNRKSREPAPPIKPEGHKIDSNKKSREPAPPIKPEGLSTEVENPKTPELQFKSKWHYKLPKIQKNAENSYLQALAKTVLSAAGKLA